MKHLALLAALLILAPARTASAGNWYEESIFFLHEDHHIFGDEQVGRDAHVDETARLIALCRPDMIQIHAKGNPGWTTYPTKVGYAPPRLSGDVLGVWRDVARGSAYRFGVYFNLGNDGRIAANHPEWIRVDPDGKPLGRAMCFHSGVAEQYLWPMLREIVTGYRPDSFWFDGTAHTVCPCYCAACRARFRREKQLPPPEGNTAPCWSEYHQMQRQIFREFIDRTVAEIHKMDPHCLIGINNTYHLMMPEKPPLGIGYLTSDIGNQVESLSPLAHWLDSQCLPFDLMTRLVTADPQSVKNGVATAVIPKPAGQIQQEMAVILANGGRYSLWDIPTPTGRLRREWIEAVVRDVTPFLRARQPWCLGRRLPDVSVLHSVAAHYAATSSSSKTFVTHDVHVHGVLAALAPRHLNYEVIPDWRLANRDVRGSLLIVEDPEAVTEEVAAGVLKFVEDGGHVLWSGRGMPSRLQAAFAVQIVAEPDKPEPLEVEGMKFRRSLFRLAGSPAQSLIKVQTSDGVQHPLLTSHAAGRGRAFFTSIRLFSQIPHQVVPAELIDKVLDAVLPTRSRRLLTNAPPYVEAVLREKDGQQIVHLVNVAAGKRQSVVYDSAVLYPGVASDGQRGIRPERIITRIPPAPACHVRLRLDRRPSSVRMEPQHQPVIDWKYEDGCLEIDVPAFTIHQMIVVTGADRNQ